MSAHGTRSQFLSRPFVVGDRIDITSSGGAKVVMGYVERVDPIYTVLRTDTGLPVTIPNKVGP
jgi:small-conductance mechanosensitive channel